MVITSLTRLSSARTVGAVCEEALLLLGPSTRRRATSPSRRRGDESYVNVNERLHLNLRLTPLIGRGGDDGPSPSERCIAGVAARRGAAQRHVVRAAHGTQEMRSALQTRSVSRCSHERKLREPPRPAPARDAHHALSSRSTPPTARATPTARRALSPSPSPRGAEYGPNPFERRAAQVRWSAGTRRRPLHARELGARRERADRLAAIQRRASSCQTSELGALVRRSSPPIRSSVRFTGGGGRREGAGGGGGGDRRQDDRRRQPTAGGRDGGGGSGARCAPLQLARCPRPLTGLARPRGYERRWRSRGGRRARLKTMLCVPTRVHNERSASPPPTRTATPQRRAHRSARPPAAARGAAAALPISRRPCPLRRTLTATIRLPTGDDAAAGDAPHGRRRLPRSKKYADGAVSRRL